MLAKWSEQASQLHEMYCHDLEVMSSNPGRVDLGVLGTSPLSHTYKFYYYSNQNTFAMVKFCSLMDYHEMKFGLNVVYFQRTWIRQG